MCICSKTVPLTSNWPFSPRSSESDKLIRALHGEQARMATFIASVLKKMHSIPTLRVLLKLVCEHESEQGSNFSTT